MMQPFAGTASQWDLLLAELPNPHLLQTWEWAQVKATYGWNTIPFIWERSSAGRQQIVAAAMVHRRQVLSRAFAARLCILYIPKGPAFNWRDEALSKEILNDLQAFARRQGAIFLKIDPDVVLGTGLPGQDSARDDAGGSRFQQDMERRGWLFSGDQIQFRNTVMLNLQPSEDELLAHMKQKFRYNVRLAERKGVKVRLGSTGDLPVLYHMYAETSVRDGFVIRDEGYYRTVWQMFMGASSKAVQPSAEPLIAEVNGEPVAAIFLFRFARRAYYIYGMSREAHREKMPNYLLQWEAIRRAKVCGCTTYDLWGAPDDFSEQDSMWGVYRFKEGLGGETVRTLGAWDFPARRFWYRTYTQVVPRLLGWMRARGRARTQRALE